MMGQHSVIFALLVSIGFVTEGSAVESLVVSLKGTAVLCCYGPEFTGSPADQQHFKWTSGGQLVAQWSQGQFTAGPGYEGRVQLSEKRVEDGNFSLTISPVEYNDEGLYDCFTGSKHLAAVTVDVLVSVTISLWVGDPVTLPCYANVNKQTDDSQLNVRWEKDGETVLQVQTGTVNTGSRFRNRVSVSPDRVRLGDLSLTFSMIRISDRGAYQCFFKDNKGTPDGIILSVAAHQSNITIQPSESLLLPLHIVEPVRVLFSSGGSTSVPVCTVEGDSVDCGPQYQHRASVHNSTLMLEYTTTADSGVYRVMDNRTNNTINTVFVSVTVLRSELISAVILLFILVSQMLVILRLTWLWHRSDIRKMRCGTRLMLLLLLLTVGLVLLGLSVTVMVKPGWKMNFAFGVNRGLFIVFQMVIIYSNLGMPWRRTVVILKLLVFLVLLGLLVTVKVKPVWKELNVVFCLGLLVFVLFQVLLIYMTVKDAFSVIRLLQDKTQRERETLQSILLAQLQWLILLLLLGFLDLGASEVVVIMGLREGLSSGLLLGMTVGMGLGVILILIILKKRYLVSKPKRTENKNAQLEFLKRSTETVADPT
ncbi:uncharacterized protein LOC114910701 [Scleropages formosus]|uniref:uncharacterized protein LOC114910701 n=1 Tax=Scleropages formosus TaxID=113540 RepID=UPI0010FAC771|nr:uncharacterized protein LOC114910701 [Scleropages formosus]